MTVSKDAIRQVRDTAGIKKFRARKVLEANGGDVEKSLIALIDSDEIGSEDLDPDLASDKIFEYAAHRSKVKFFEQALNPAGGLFGMLAKGAKKDGQLRKITEIAQQLKKEAFGNKTAEELVEESDRERRERIKKLNKSAPQLAKKVKTAGETARSFNRIRRRIDAMKKNPKSLKLKPFPTLKMDSTDWTGQETLPAWKGYYARDEDGMKDIDKRRAKAANSKFDLSMPRLDDDDGNPRPPAPEQVKAYQYLKDNQARIRNAALVALLEFVQKIRKVWLKHSPDLELPDPKSVADLKTLLHPGDILMHPYAKGGYGYVGLSFGCTWDPEHGAGVLMHKDRVILAGQADASFDDFKIKKDGGKLLK